MKRDLERAEGFMNFVSSKVTDSFNQARGCHGCDCMVVGFTTTYAISAYHHTNVVSSNFDQGEVYNIM